MMLELHFHLIKDECLKKVAVGEKLHTNKEVLPADHSTIIPSFQLDNK